MLIIGLTGGIGSGKTVASQLFNELGIPVIDADVVARQIVQPGQPALEELRILFGNGILTPDGQLDRAELRSIVFSDSTKRKRLEAILHPRIREEMRRQAHQLNSPYCIFAIPLMVETGQKNMVDLILVIDSSDELRRQRIKQRDNLNDNQIDAIFAAQATRDQRLACADDVIHNDADLAHLKAQVIELNRRYTELAELKKLREN
jgi:dephospho-CoA kinase